MVAGAGYGAYMGAAGSTIKEAGSGIAELYPSQMNFRRCCLRSLTPVTRQSTLLGLRLLGAYPKNHLPWVYN